MKSYFLWLAKFLTIILVFFFLIPSLIIGLGVASTQAVKLEEGKGKDPIAVVELTGMILDSKEIVKRLYSLSEDDSVKGIVLRIDSPGGAVGPSQEIYTAIKNIKSVKPVVASMGSMAASGGLYSALGASKIVAQPGTLTGSIGVIIQFPNMTKIADQVGFKMVTVKSGKLKDVGNTFRPMTETDLEFLQSTVDSIYDDFFRAVVESRGLEPAMVKKFADGRIITGAQAVELQLIDAIGDIYDAGRLVHEILGTPLAADELPNLLYPDDTFEKFKKFLEAVLDMPVRLAGVLQQPKMQVLYSM